ncbi:nitrogenase molybdenum-iron protein subunit beta [Spirochaeta cellobiosiphila]|uniref:nitrogenase molybdenum-iron protein subunit beta n=1 Tax=Spirochaeta cellobiosiphila TaxID=504483 RepID=UPI000400CF7E|nr:nitrogenase molybdenum-iron protein subunit beta [Spirochaeta cellobiosiphila]
MLLRHTTADVVEREGLTINPVKTCQPVGAMYAALGIHGCLPHSHGSQGCCAYHRSALTRHYKEPVMAGTSSFTEGASVFGGQANLLQAVNNIFTIYDPEIIAVHSTCLSETIGDDLNQILIKAQEDGKVPEGKSVISAPTPSYVGSHITGFSAMVEAMVKYLSINSGKSNGKVNLIPGWVEPCDMRQIKSIAKRMGVENILFPDTSDVLDAPLIGKHQMYPDGGVTKEELVSAGDSIFTIAMGSFASEQAAKLLNKKCNVDYEVLDIPVGIKATDRFIMKLSQTAGVEVPSDFKSERGRLVDVITDQEQYLHGKRVAIFGDPDQLIPLTEFLLDLNMEPVYVVSGTPGKYFEKRIKELFEQYGIDGKVKNGPQADMFLLHQWIKEQGVDLLIGNTYGKYIARDEDLPFLRYGFPIYDRVGHSYFTTLGYEGGLRIVEKILGLFHDRQDRDAPEERFELVM